MAQSWHKIFTREGYPARGRRSTPLPAGSRAARPASGLATGQQGPPAGHGGAQCATPGHAVGVLLANRCAPMRVHLHFKTTRRTHPPKRKPRRGRAGAGLPRVGSGLSSQARDPLRPSGDVPWFGRMSFQYTPGSIGHAIRQPSRGSPPAIRGQPFAPGSVQAAPFSPAMNRRKVSRRLSNAAAQSDV